MRFTYYVTSINNNSINISKGILYLVSSLLSIRETKKAKIFFILFFLNICICFDQFKATLIIILTLRTTKLKILSYPLLSASRINKGRERRDQLSELVQRGQGSNNGLNRCAREEKKLSPQIRTIFRRNEIGISRDSGLTHHDPRLNCS